MPAIIPPRKSKEEVRAGAFERVSRRISDIDIVPAAIDRDPWVDVARGVLQNQQSIAVGLNCFRPQEEQASGA